jgi:PTH1 family peptidyl-tRNA hydrolase
MVLSALFDAYASEGWREHKPWKAIAAKASIVGVDALLVAPLLFMNESGKSLVPLVKSKKQAAQTIVLHDDIDLPLGTWRLSFERGSGGHNGVESVMAALKTKAFVRIRIGVLPVRADGKPKKPKGEDRVVRFVLGKFTDPEREEIRRVAKDVVAAMPILVTEGVERAMNRFN